MQSNLQAVDLTLACGLGTPSVGNLEETGQFFERYRPLTRMTTELLTERHGSILVITLSGPATRNTLSSQVVAAGIETLNVAEANPDVSSVVITGAGGQFCSGADFQLAAGLHKDLADHANDLDAFQQWIESLDSFPKPLIAAVEGLAAGPGLALALACDLVVASEASRLSAHTAHVPAIPIGGLARRLERSLGRARALEILWQSTPLLAPQCHAWGLVQRLTPPGQALNGALAWLEDIAALPSAIVAGTKELVNEAEQARSLNHGNIEKTLTLKLFAQGAKP